MNVQVTPGYAVDGWVEGTLVKLGPLEYDSHQSVYLDGRMIGFVWKGSRRYSPPTHRGSRVARYHKNVPEWHANQKPHMVPRYRRDTRQEVLRDLIAAARKDAS
jgi:hypothetical protein